MELYHVNENRVVAATPEHARQAMIEAERWQESPAGLRLLEIQRADHLLNPASVAGIKVKGPLPFLFPSR